MAFSLHDEETIGSVHIPHDLEYANQSARKTDSTLLTRHEGRLALQTDDNSMWRCSDAATPSWELVSPPPPVVGDIGKVYKIITDGASDVKAQWTDYSLDEVYTFDGSVAARSVDLDLGGLTWNPTGAYSFVVDATGSDQDEGFQVVNSSGTNFVWATRASTATDLNFVFDVSTFGGACTYASITASQTVSIEATSSTLSLASGGDLGLYPIGASSVKVDLQYVTGSSDGYEIIDSGSEYFRAYTNAGTGIYLSCDATTLDFDLSGAVAIDGSSMHIGVNPGTVDFIDISSGLVHVSATASNGASRILLETTQAYVGDGTSSPSYASGSDLLMVYGESEFVGDTFFVGSINQGSGTAGHTPDVYFTGVTEIDGYLWCDSYLILENQVAFLYQGLHFGGNIVPDYGALVPSTDDGLLFAAGRSGSGNNNIIITNTTNIGSDHDHSSHSTNPTLFIHSNTDPDSNNQQWGSMAHNQTNFVCTTGSGDWILDPSGSVNIGDGTPTFAGNNDLFVSADIELDGDIYISGTAYIGVTGSTGQTAINWNTDQTNAAAFLGLASSNYLSICEKADMGTDFGVSNQTNPTLFIHSADATDTTQWISFTHDQTDGVIDCGTGTLNLGGTANINLAGASMAGTTVTHDDYFEIEIGGVTKKVMCGS